jgi:Phytanoyl-CoA dioxygenase (PhyH)
VVLGLSDSERYRFDLDGFLVRPSVLLPDTVDLLNRACDSLTRPEADEAIMSQRFDGLLDKPDHFDLLLAHPEAIAIVTELCGPTVRLDHAYGIQMRPGTSGLGLHGGATPHDPSQYYRWHDGQMFNGLVGVMWGLSPSNPGDGGFCCIPGSHKANLPLPADVATDSVVEVTLPPGSMLVFTEALTHGTLPWHGSQDRRSVVYKYAPGFLAWHPPPGFSDDVYGQSYRLGRVRQHHFGMRTGIAAALLHPPYIPGHPEISDL